jgi:hypothetical protein
MSMAWDVSEPRPPTSLLFFPGWYVSVDSLGADDDDDDAGWGKLPTRPPELCGSPTNRDIWEQVGGMDEGVRILRISIWDTSTHL